MKDLRGSLPFGRTYGMKGQQVQGTKALQGKIEGNRIFQSEEETVLRGPAAFQYLGGSYKKNVASFPVMHVRRTNNRHE